MYIDIKYITFDGGSGLDRFSDWTAVIHWMQKQRAAGNPVLIVSMQAYIKGEI